MSDGAKYVHKRRSCVAGVHKSVHFVSRIAMHSTLTALNRRVQIGAQVDSLQQGPLLIPLVNHGTLNVANKIRIRCHSLFIGRQTFSGYTIRG